MKNIQDLLKSLPDKNIPFEIDVQGSTTGIKYTGSFVVTVPSSADMSRVGVEIAKLGGGVKFEHLDIGTRVLHNAVGYLKVCLTDCPKWFLDTNHGLDLIDNNVTIEVFNLADDAVEAWRNSLRDVG